MPNARLLALALCLAGATAACSPEEHRQAEAILTAVGVPPVADPAPEPIPEPEPAAPPPPVIVAAPAPIVEECVTIFRVQTCEAGVLHHLDSNMAWVD